MRYDLYIIYIYISLGVKGLKNGPLRIRKSRCKENTSVDLVIP